MDESEEQIERGSALEPLIAERSLARRWHHALRTLQRWRREGHMPPPLVIGRRVFYRQRDVETFERRVLDRTGRGVGR
jgi:predicted site-specific integrase-resolvase